MRFHDTKKKEYYDGYSTVIQDTESMQFMQDVQKKASKLNVEEYYDESYNVTITYIKQNKSKVYRRYTLKVNKKNKDYLQKLMDELKHTEKFTGFKN